MNVEGSARIACIVTDTGSLTDCSIVDESPPDFGFGQAALKLAHVFKMKLIGSDGRSTSGGLVTVPVNFRLPQSSPPPLPSGSRP
jgi:protein TonB